MERLPNFVNSFDNYILILFAFSIIGISLALIVMARLPERLLRRQRTSCDLLGAAVVAAIIQAVFHTAGQGSGWDLCFYGVTLFVSFGAVLHDGIVRRRPF